MTLDYIRAAWDAHSGYLRSKGAVDFSDQWSIVSGSWGSYTGFGLVAQILEFIPLVNVIAYFSNFAAAALWAASMDLEEAAEVARYRTYPELTD